MNFDFETPHTWYVIAAYAVAALGYLAITVHTLLKSCAVNNRLRKLDKIP